jgi:hypothetical protein
MSIANQTNFNMASLNGLVDINADTVSSTIIDTDEINTTILFINDVDVGAQIEENAHKLTAIDYTDTPTPTTTISSSLVVEELADFEANVNILGTTNLKNTNITGDTYLIDDADTSKQLKIHWFGAGNGYWFESMNNGAYIYFVVKSVSGNVRAFQFNYNQLYSSIPFFCDNTFSLSNQPLYFGTDACNIVFVADGGPSNGWRFTNALNNFYTNWFSRDTGGNYINTFRLHHSKISSLIDHEFIGNLLVNSSTISPVELSYLDGITSNIQTQLNGRLLSSGGTITGNLLVNGTFRAVGYTTLGLTTINGVAYNYDWTYFYKDIIFAHSGTKLILTTPNTSLTQTELSYLSGVSSNIQNQFSAKLDLTGGTLSGNLTFNSGTASLNKITQSIISGDISANSNLLKYTIMSHNSNSASGTSQRVLSLTDTFNSNALWFIPNISNGSFNSLCSTNAKAIIAANPNDNSSFVLTVWGSQKNGMKISTTSSTNAQTELWAGNSTSIVLNNISGITQTNTASINFTNGTTQTTAYNSTTAGYSLSGLTLTFPTGTILNCAVGGVGNEIKCHKFNCYNVIEFPDGSLQNTAYTPSKDTKLTNIGSITTSVLSVDALIVSNVIFNCGVITLPAGTYTLTMNCGINIVTGSTSVGQLLLSHSTSAIALTTNSNLIIDNGFGNTWNAGIQKVMSNTAIVTPTVTTNYYMLLQVSFGTANRVQFTNGISNFQAIRIA